MERAPQSPRRFLVWLFGILIVILVVGLGAAYGVSSVYARRFPPRMSIGTVPVGGMDYLQALAAVQARADVILDQGLTFTDGQRPIALPSTIASPDEFSYDLFTLDAKATLDQAFADVTTGPLVPRILKQLSSVLFGRMVGAHGTVDAAALTKALQDAVAKEVTPAVNAGVAVDPKTLAVTVTSEKAGTTYRFSEAVSQASKQLARLDLTQITLVLVTDTPTVAAADVLSFVPQVQSALQRAPFTLLYQDKTFSLTAADVGQALTFARQGKTIRLAVDADKLASTFDAMAKAIEVPVSEGRFRMAGGKVVEFSENRAGTAIDRAATAGRLAAVLTEGEPKAEIAVQTVEPKFSSDTAGTLGITELVAQGKTNFAGSPPNRRFNIGVGAAKLNGLLIRPGEAFSLITAVGPVDGKNGYRQELVIKGDRTIPEYGGGLCQIGTTMFRLVLDAGLPILERVNHSYRVRYYEPPVGMDATIYEPKPDFRFTNDYAAPLLLQARIEGDTLVFEFYGTKDTRIATTTTPKVFNVVAAPPKKTIESPDLKPGEEKCIEKAHPGSDASFTYTVQYPDGRTDTRTFKSHYKPWGEVCLVGPKKEKKPKPTTTNKNTNASVGVNVNTNANTNASAAVNANANVNTNAD